MSGLFVTHAGQDITSYVDEMQTDIISALAQGPGVGSGGAAHSTTCTLYVRLGPAASAIGAGETIPTPKPKNLLTANQSDIETDVSGFSTAASNLLGGNLPATMARDTSKSWHGAASLHMQTPAGLTGGSAGIETTPGLVIPANTQLTVSFYFQSPTGGGALRFYDYTNNNTPTSGITLPTPTSPPGQWVRVAYTYTQAQATNDLRFAIRSSSTSQDFWIDGLQVEIGPTATEWALGGEITTPPLLVRQGELVVVDASGSKVFGGYVTKLTDQTAVHELVPYTQIDAVDYWADLDRVQVNEAYTGRSDTYIIRDLLTKYAPWIDQSLIPGTDNYTFTKRLIRSKTLRQAIQEIADITGFMVWADADTRLHYSSATSASTAPFDLSDDPNFISSQPHVIGSGGGGGGGYTEDLNAIINRVFFYGGRKPSDDFDQDLSVQANGNNTQFALLYYPHEASDGKVHVIKNGTDLVLYSVFDTDPTHKLKSDPNGVGTADVLINADAETLIFDTAPLATDTLICRYRYQTPLVIILKSTTSFQTFGRWFDGKIVDESVLDINTALQRARTLLAEQAFGLVTIQATTWTSGLQAGQLVRIVNRARGLDGTYLIQKVETKPLGAGSFEYDLTLGAWNWSLIDLLIWQARQADSQDTTSEADTDIIQAQEHATAATAVAVWINHVRQSGVYYSRTSAVGDGHDAYSGFFTVTS